MRLRMGYLSVAAAFLLCSCEVDGVFGGGLGLSVHPGAVDLRATGPGSRQQGGSVLGNSMRRSDSYATEIGAGSVLGSGLLAFAAPVLRKSPESDRVLGLTAASCCLAGSSGWKKRRALLSGICFDSSEHSVGPLGPSKGLVSAAFRTQQGSLIAQNVWVDRRTGADTGEFDDDDDSYGELSAQEKRMMKRLKEKMRRHQQQMDAAARRTTPPVKRKASQQQSMMRKERLQEKLALRGQAPADLRDRPMGFQKDRAAAPKEPRHDARKVRSGQAPTGGLRSLSSQKAAKSPAGSRHTKKRNFTTPAKGSGASRSGSAIGGVQMPDLSALKNPEDVLDKVEDALKVEQGQMTGVFAVSALNKLKKCPRHIVNKARLGGRMDSIMSMLGNIVARDVDQLTGKHLSLAVNAVAETRGREKLMRAVASRSIELAREDPKLLDIQAIAVILNAFARAGMRDEVLFSALSQVACKLAEESPQDFNAQSVSVIANAFSKMRIKNTPLFEHLSRVAMTINPSNFGPQAVSNLLNAFARLDERDAALFSYLSKVVKQTDPKTFLPHHLAITVNAYAKMEMLDESMLKYVDHLIRARHPSSYDAQAVANILNAYARLLGEATSPKLVSHMTSALKCVNLATLDPSTMSIALHALVKVGCEDEALYRRLKVAAKVTDPLLFDAQAVSTIMHSYAKVGVDNLDLFDSMAAVAIQMQYSFDPQSASLVLNACAKLEYKNEALMSHLSKVVSKFSAEDFDAQHVDNILNAFARLEVRDSALFVHMANIIQEMNPDKFDAQSVGVIMNAYAKMMNRDEITADLYSFFSNLVLPTMPMGNLTPLSVSVILNSYAKAEIREEQVIRMLGACVQRGNDAPLSIGKFEIRHIASVLHAYAQLDIDQEDVVNAMWQQLLHFPVEKAQPEEIAVIAWSVTVLNLQDMDLIEWLMKGLELQWDRMEHSLRRQGRQFLLGCELEGLVDPQTGAMRGRKGSKGQTQMMKLIQNAAAVDEHQPSRLQEDVAGILTEMGLEFKQEYVDERSGYSVDMLMGDQRTAIEVDGPSHYAAQSQDPLGHSIMKHRQLEQLGFDVRILPYWEWDQLDTKDKKIEYIKNLLTATPSPLFLL